MSIALQCCVAGGIVLLLVYIPDISLLTGQIYQVNRFDHWDAYVMGPALAFRHGAALGTHFFSQYGVGWPMLLAEASTFAPLTYKMALQFAIVFGCAYFLLVFVFLRMLLRSAPWALAGLLLAICLQLFSGNPGPPKWCWPSSTVLRSSLDMIFLIVCLAYARRNWTSLGLPAGALLGLVVLFGTDTGVYLSAAFVAFLLAAARVQSGSIGPRRTWLFAILAAAGFAVTLGAGLAIAGRGTLFQAAFWRGWLESLLEYSAGISQLPVGSALGQWSDYLFFFMEILAYLFFFGSALAKWRQKSLSPDALMLGTIALYGLGTLTIFIGRSHPFNMYHPSVPFSILLTSALATTGVELGTLLETARPSPGAPLFRATLRSVPWACVYLALVAVFANGNFQQYPNLLHGSYPDPNVARPVDHYLFAARRDVIVPEELLPEGQRIAAIAGVLAKLSEGGRHSVAVLDFGETTYLVQADLKPYFRYSPFLAGLFFKEQVDTIDRQLIEHPPEYVVLPDQAWMTDRQVRSTDVYDRAMARLNGRYTVIEKVYDMVVFKRGGS